MQEKKDTFFSFVQIKVMNMIDNKYCFPHNIRINPTGGDAMEVTNLKAYLANIGMSLKDFCEIIECDDKHMSHVMNGKKRAGHRLAKDVRQATSGLINLETRWRKLDQKRQDAQRKQQQDSAA